MKVRIIRKPQYFHLHNVQVKRWWWPFWVTVFDADLDQCLKAAHNLIKTKNLYSIVYEGETE